MRNVAAVVVGYLTMFVLVMVLFTGLYQILGANRAFQPESYTVSATWAVISQVLGLVAAILGGVVCARIAGDHKAVTYLAALVFALGVVFAIPSLTAGDVALAERAADVGNLEAMQNAVTPVWIAILTPIVGAIGVLIGGRSVRQEATTPSI